MTGSGRRAYRKVAPRRAGTGFYLVGMVGTHAPVRRLGAPLDHYRTWWSYFPILSTVYVYAYAFGELTGAALYELYMREEAGFVPMYLDFWLRAER